MPINYVEWQAYPWKNELALQLGRVEQHFAEVLDGDYDGAHSPISMFDRAIVTAAFCIRRLSEMMLLTDMLRTTKFSVTAYPSSSYADFRLPFRSMSGREPFRDYNFAAPLSQDMTINDVANQIIHSRQLMVIGGEKHVANGILVASDYRQRDMILHMTIEEFLRIGTSAYDDRVRIATDGWDPETGKITTKRL